MTAKENNFIEELERVIKDRAESIDINKSYIPIKIHNFTIKYFFF